MTKLFSLAAAGRGAAAAVLCFALASPAQSQNLVVNGGFETGDFSGWTLQRTLTSYVRSDYPFSTHSGNAAAWLEYVSPGYSQCTSAACGPSDGRGTYISQFIPTIPDHVYRISYWAKSGGFQYPYDRGDRSRLNVYFGELIINDPGYFGFDYHYWENEFAEGSIITAFDTTTELFIPFQASDPIFLDDISVVDYGPWYEGWVDQGPWQDPTATPEPATILLLATGLIGIGVVARRRRSTNRRV